LAKFSHEFWQDVEKVEECGEKVEECGAPSKCIHSVFLVFLFFHWPGDIICIKLWNSTCKPIFGYIENRVERLISDESSSQDIHLIYGDDNLVIYQDQEVEAILCTVGLVGLRCSVYFPLYI